MRFLNLRVLVGVVILIILLFLGFFLFSQKSPVSSPTTPNAPVVSTENIKAQIDKNSVFDLQNALIKGKVVDIFESSIKVENKKGAQATFPLNNPFYVYKQDAQGKNTVGTKIEDIEENKDVTINFQLIDGEYKVTSLSYL